MSPASINRKGDVPSNVDSAMKVFAEYGDFIRSIISFNVRNETEAEDIFQDFFLSLISKPMPEEVRNARGFLYQVVSHRVKDAFRRIERYQAKIHRYAAEHHGCIIGYRPEKAVTEAEETKKMFELIERRLPPTEALAVRLRYRDDYDTTEAAAKMKVRPRTVSRYVSVGLKKLRHVFGVN